jgi:hypothetical protein
MRRRSARDSGEVGVKRQEIRTGVSRRSRPINSSNQEKEIKKDAFAKSIFLDG